MIMQKYMKYTYSDNMNMNTKEEMITVKKLQIF